MTVAGASAVIVESVTGLERAKAARGRPLFVIMSRERAKLSYRWKPAVCWRPVREHGRLVRNEDTGDIIITPRCPGVRRRGPGRRRDPVQRRGAGKEEEEMPPVRRSALDRGPDRAQDLPPGRLRQEPDARLLPAPDRRRDSRV